MTQCAVIKENGRTTGYWFNDKNITNDPMMMTVVLTQTNQVDGDGFAALLNKQYSVKPDKHNGIDGYLVSLKR
jgi:hypothetical protein